MHENFQIYGRYVATLTTLNDFTGSMDYIFEPHLLRLIHEREVLINVSVINDDILEGNETFILTISQDSLSNNRDINVTVGRYAQATVTIVDTTSE